MHRSLTVIPLFQCEPMRKTLRTSVITYLLKLPELFSISDMCKQLNMPRDRVKTYIYRWKQRGLVQDLGPRCGIYFNLLKNPNAHDAHLYSAIKRLYPSAVLGGEQVLHDHGWTTQIPQYLSIYVATRRDYTEIHGVQLLPRNVDWYHRVHNYIDRSGDLPTLKAEMVIADMWKNPEGQWVPDPDDLYLDKEDAEKIQVAARLLDVAVMPDYDLDDIAMGLS